MTNGQAIGLAAIAFAAWWLTRRPVVTAAPPKPAPFKPATPSHLLWLNRGA